MFSSGGKSPALPHCDAITLRFREIISLLTLVKMLISREKCRFFRIESCFIVLFFHAAVDVIFRQNDILIFFDLTKFLLYDLIQKFSV